MAQTQNWLKSLPCVAKKSKMCFTRLLVFLMLCDLTSNPLCPAEHSRIGEMALTPTPGPIPPVMYSWADDDHRPMNGGDQLTVTDAGIEGVEPEG
jgi:hypothetical protein